MLRASRHSVMAACVLVQILVLSWCVSQRDVEVVRKVVEQLCLANAPQNGVEVSKTAAAAPTLGTAFSIC